MDALASKFHRTMTINAVDASPGQRKIYQPPTGEDPGPLAFNIFANHMHHVSLRESARPMLNPYSLPPTQRPTIAVTDDEVLRLLADSPIDRWAFPYRPLGQGLVEGGDFPGQTATGGLYNFMSSKARETRNNEDVVGDYMALRQWMAGGQVPWDLAD